MSLKPKKASTVGQTSESTSAPLTGPWGRINPSHDSVDAIRFCQGSEFSKQKSHSYPYRVLASWHWSKSINDEELAIKANADLITIRGRGLDRLVEALESGSLELVSEIPEDQPESGQYAVWVTMIEVSTNDNS